MLLFPVTTTIISPKGNHNWTKLWPTKIICPYCSFLHPFFWQLDSTSTAVLLFLLHYEMHYKSLAEADARLVRFFWLHSALISCSRLIETSTLDCNLKWIFIRAIRCPVSRSYTLDWQNSFINCLIVSLNPTRLSHAIVSSISSQATPNCRLVIKFSFEQSGFRDDGQG